MTTTTQEIFIGIDISKDKLDVAIWGQKDTWDFRNEAEGRQELIELVKAIHPSLIVVKASGGLEQPIVAELSLEELPVAIVNPTCVRNFARSIGQLAKN